MRFGMHWGGVSGRSQPVNSQKLCPPRGWAGAPCVFAPQNQKDLVHRKAVIGPGSLWVQQWLIDECYRWVEGGRKKWKEERVGR